jgi:hypothetical protein
VWVIVIMMCMTVMIMIIVTMVIVAMMDVVMTIMTMIVRYERRFADGRGLHDMTICYFDSDGSLSSGSSPSPADFGDRKSRTRSPADGSTVVTRMAGSTFSSISL